MTPPGFWWVVPLVSFFTALLGAGAAYAGLVWRFRSDFRNKVVEELCKDISSAADLATEYWLIDLQKPMQGQPDAARAAVLAAKVWGMADKIDHSIEIARPHLSAIDMLGLDVPLGHMLDSLTGGQFREPDRPIDDDRAISAQTSAASVIRHIKRAASRKALGT